MQYHMHINSDENIIVYNRVLKEDVVLEVVKKYIITYIKPTNKKDRKNNGRMVELLGFSSDFMADVIVKYIDTQKRGRVGACDLVEIKNGNT